MASLSGHPLHSTRADAVASTKSNGLWGHLLRASQAPSSSSSSHTPGKPPSLAPLDKTGASTRILLHDTQANLEKFTESVTRLTTSVNDTKRELIAIQKLYQDDHEQLVERMIGLVNRCQTELKRSIGTPVQCGEMREVAKDIGTLGVRLEALDKRIDVLYTANQTQSKALQTIQDQQNQILAAILPVLPLLQAVPLHIENARNHVRDSIIDLRQFLPSCSGPTSSNEKALSKRTRSLSRSVLAGSMDLSSSPDRKKLRLDPVASPLADDVPMATIKTPVPNVLEGSTANIRSPDIPLKPIISYSTRRSISRSPLADLVLPQPSAADGTIDFGRNPAHHIAASPVHALRSSVSVRSNLAPGNNAATRTPTRASSAQAHMHAAHIPTTTSFVDFTGVGRATRLPSFSFATPRDRSEPMRRRAVAQTPLRTAASSYARPSVTPRLSAAEQDSGAGLAGDRSRSSSQLPDQGSDMRSPSVPPSGGKLMSLKDRRALIPEVGMEGKRFIALDDEDDEDIVLLE